MLPDLQLSVRNAIIAKAAADLAPVKVYPHPPADAPMPFVSLDRVIEEPDDLLDSTLTRCQVYLSVWSAVRGSAEASGLCGKLRASLHDATLVLGSGDAILCRVTRSDVVRDADGVTYMGSVQVMVSAND